MNGCKKMVSIFKSQRVRTSLGVKLIIKSLSLHVNRLDIFLKKMKGQRGERGDVSEFVSGIHLYEICWFMFWNRYFTCSSYNEEPVLTKPNSFGLIRDRF